MITSARQAREIANKRFHEGHHLAHFSFTSKGRLRCNTCLALGYLQCLTHGEEVKAFVDLESCFKSCKRWKSSDGVCCACADRYFKALAAYREAVKGENPNEINRAKQKTH